MTSTPQLHNSNTPSASRGASRAANKKRGRYYAIAAAVVVLALIGLHSRNGAPTDAPIRTDKVELGTVATSVSGNGTLQAYQSVEVKSNVGGQIVELAVDEGDYVKAGQLIARIDPSDSQSALEQAQADYIGAQAKVDQSRLGSIMQQVQTSASIENAAQALEVSRQRYAQAKQQAAIQPKLTDQSIKQAESSLASARANLIQTKTALVPQKQASAKANYDQAKATLDQTEKELARQRALLEKGFVSRSSVDTAEQQYSVAKAQLENAKSKLDTIKQEADEDLNAAEARFSEAKANLEAAQANRIQVSIKQQELAAARASMNQAAATLASAKASAFQNQMKTKDILQSQASLERAKAAVTNARTQLGYTTITAPMSGVVVKKYVEKGSIVTAGRSAFGGGTGAGITLVDIADINRMQVVVDVDETDIARITLGQEVDVTVDAYPNDIFKARVIKIAPEAVVEQNVTTVPVTVELTHADRRLKPEMNATCDFIINRKRNVLRVPSEAVKQMGRGAMIMVMENGKPVPRNVQTGLAGDEFTEIVSGLKEGETVVTVAAPSAMQEAPNGAQRGGMRGPRPF